MDKGLGGRSLARALAHLALPIDVMDTVVGTDGTAKRTLSGCAPSRPATCDGVCARMQGAPGQWEVFSKPWAAGLRAPTMFACWQWESDALDSCTRIAEEPPGWTQDNEQDSSHRDAQDDTPSSKTDRPTASTCLNCIIPSVILTQQVDSIAVLPFENATADPDTENVSDSA
jgi:hypothetical protein